MLRRSLCFILLLSALVVQGQQFGGFAPSAKWSQISTDTARIIFQAPLAAQAQRIASLVHRMAAARPNKLGNAVQKINIVLHGNTTEANGYVGLAPFRSEFYLIPSSDIFALGTLPWQDHLAIHEYRHVQQYNNMNRGLAKVFRAVLGEEGQALANALAVPAWFFEGDAVHAETTLTPQGRGRLPYFMGGPASIWLSGKNYKTAKWLNGSLKDYVPNHYQFGYLLTNWGYKHWGENFWPQVIADASAFKGLPTPLRSAIKKRTGQRFETFVQEAFLDYKKELINEPPQPAVAGTVTHRYFPQQIGEDSLLYLESSYQSLPYFVIRHQGVARKIAMRRLSSEDWFTYRAGTIAYAAYATDARWSLTDYSDIILLNIATGKEKKLTAKARYFTPDISPSGKKIAAVHIDSATRTSLHILDATSGKVLQQLPIGEGTFLLHPRFIDEDHLTVVHRRRNGSIALHQWDLSNQTNKLVLYAGFNTLGYPYADNGKIYVTSSASGSDDIYAFDIEKENLEKLTNTATGAYFVSATKDSIYFSEFTAGGLRLKSAAASGVPLDKNFLATERPRFAPSADTSNLLQTPTRDFAVKRYKKGTGLLHFHSWRPYYEDPELTFTAYSNNILNTLEAAAFYRYNQSERSHGVGANVAYGGLFPVISGGVEYTANRHLRTPAQTFLFQQWEARAGASVPLNFSQGKTYKFFRVGSDVVFNRLMPQGKDNPFQPRNRTYLYHYLSFSQQLPRARQHIFPRWGYAIVPQWQHQLSGTGYQVLVNAQAYLPSVHNHSLVLGGSVQTTDTALGLFSNRFANSRGYADYYLPRMWRLSAAYHFPIAYPDWGFGSLFYLQRIRADVYYDHAQVWSPGKMEKRLLRSAGTEVFFDTKWLSQLETSIGIRYSYLLDRGLSGSGNKNSFSIVLPTNLIPD